MPEVGHIKEQLHVPHFVADQLRPDHKEALLVVDYERPSLGKPVEPKSLDQLNKEPHEAGD